MNLSYTYIHPQQTTITPSTTPTTHPPTAKTSASPRARKCRRARHRTAPSPSPSGTSSLRGCGPIVWMDGGVNKMYVAIGSGQGRSGQNTTHTLHTASPPPIKKKAKRTHHAPGRPKEWSPCACVTKSLVMREGRICERWTCTCIGPLIELCVGLVWCKCCR